MIITVGILFSIICIIIVFLFQLNVDLDWSNVAVAAMNDLCTIAVNNNAGGWVDDGNGQVGPPADILENLCPGNCNDNGNCVLGKGRKGRKCIDI